MIAGLDDSPYSKKIASLGRRTLKDKFVGIGVQPFSQAPLVVSMADIVVIPQRETISTLGQMPAKVFDAMAMQKPVVATKVNDLPRVLDDYGWLVEPQAPNQIAEAINYILAHPEEAKEKAEKARKCFLKYYSYTALSRRIHSILKKFE